MIESAGELMSSRAGDKGLDLATIIDPTVPDMLLGDPARVRQILLNLAGNALKFTETGGVTIAATLAPKSTTRKPVIHFAVTDTGIGLTPEQQGRLFKAFAQADVSTSRKYGGTGLGLSISQRLCELMHGTIGVKSEIGKGSTFWFELPFDVAEENAPASIKIDDAHVVMIGFQGIAREAATAILQVHGVTQVAWLDFSDDLARLVSDSIGKNPAAIFVSAQGDEAHALAAGHTLVQQNPSNARVILVASHALASTLTEAERTGFFATVTLPLRRGRMAHVIAAALGRADLGQRTVSDSGAKFSPPTIEEARAANVLILVAEDNATNQIVINRMLSQRGYAVEIVENGVEALRALEANTGYGLLLTDFHMPEMDGFTLTAEVRKREASGSQRLPIVALTADALPGTEQRCIAAGMDGYLTKPIESKNLTAALEKWLPGAAALRRPATRAAKKAATVQIDPQIFDTARFTETFGPASDETRTVLAQFLEEARKMAAAVSAAMEAEDWAGARHHAHALKGAGSSIGAVRLGQLASDVQDCLDGNDPDTAGLFVAGLDTTVDELVQAVQPLIAKE